MVESELDAGGAEGDLAGDEVLAAAGALVIEENARHGEHVVALAVVDREVVAIHLGAGIRAAGVEFGVLGLGWVGRAEHLRARRLVEADRGIDEADRFEEAGDAGAGDVGGRFGGAEADADVALGGEVVDLGGADLADEGDERARFAEVAELEVEVGPQVVADGGADLVEAPGVDGGGAAGHAVDFVALVEEELGEVGAVLARDAGDEGDLAVGQVGGVGGLRHQAATPRSWPASAASRNHL